MKYRNKKQRGGRMTEFMTAREEDFPEILHMIKEIYEELPCKEWFSLDEGGKCW